jgi:proteasome lid subunit RPN8/RPN11
VKRYRILKSQLEKIINEAAIAAKGGKEICGLLIYNGYLIELIKTRNKSKKDGRGAYYYEEVRYIETAASKLEHQIIGTFHSHPFYIAKPGENDIANAVDNSLMLIIDALDRKTALWHIKHGRIRKIKFVLLYKAS